MTRDAVGAGGTADDRGTALAAAWAAAVRANREQAERVRETPTGDFYAPVHRLFVADPRRTDDPVLDALLDVARPDDAWLDIGAGAGRFALPLALHVREVVALDPSPSMLDALRDGMAEHEIRNIRPIEGRWPLVPELAPTLRVDVTLIAHVGYDIEEMEPFLAAMESTTERVCVAVAAERPPSSPAAPFWPAVHGEERHQLPGYPELVALLAARGRAPDVRVVERSQRSYTSREDALRWLRNQCFTVPGSAADLRLAAELDRRAIEDADGRIRLPGSADVAVAVVAWLPD